MDDLERAALLRTVDRVLAERGQDPDTVTEEDKFSIAAQYVQLCALHEHSLKKATQQLSEALGTHPELPLEELVLDAVARIGERSPG